MKRILLLIWSCLGLLNLACSPQSISEDMPINMLPGSDRDEHGCIGSAGYEWSNALSECIRLFEQGIALENAQDFEASSLAYLVRSRDGQTLELFATDGTSALLSQNKADEWRDQAGDYIIKLGSPASYVVYNGEGAKLYFEDQTQAMSEADWGPTSPDPETENETETLNEFGILRDVQDGAYPFYSATVEFPKRQFEIALTINIENLNLSPEELLALDGQYVAFEYTTGIEKMVFDMELESGFLMGSQTRDDLRDYTVARGIMGGADVTRGDLPGSFYLEDAEDNRIYFEEYITEEMMAGNGRDVIIYYETRTRNVITKIEKPEDPG